MCLLFSRHVLNIFCKLLCSPSCLARTTLVLHVLCPNRLFSTQGVLGVPANLDGGWWWMVHGGWWWMVDGGRVTGGRKNMLIWNISKNIQYIFLNDSRPHIRLLRHFLKNKKKKIEKKSLKKKNICFC